MDPRCITALPRLLHASGLNEDCLVGTGADRACWKTLQKKRALIGTPCIFWPGLIYSCNAALLALANFLLCQHGEGWIGVIWKPWLAGNHWIGGSDGLGAVNPSKDE